MNRTVYPLLILCVGFINQNFVWGQKEYPFNEVIEKWSEDEDLKNASVGFYAVDLKEGQVIADLNGQKSMVPASMMKLSTTIAALDILGPDYQFENGLYHSGFIDDNGVLYGDLIFSGNGDPTFGSTRLGERPDRLITAFSDAIKKMGIRQVVGNVLVDNAAFRSTVPGTWSWEDLTNYYAAIPHPLNFLENQFTMVFSTGVVGTNAILNSVTPEVPGMTIQNEVLAGNVSGDETFCYGHPFSGSIEIRGELPPNQRAYKVKGAIPNPGIFFATKVMNAAQRSGVKWEGDISEIKAGESGQQSAEVSLIVNFPSPPLREIVAQTNKYSVNLFAEGLLVSLGEQPGLESGLKRISEFWKQHLPERAQGFEQKDGSGLSHYNAVSARQLTEMLVFAHARPIRTEFENSLPVSGESGTLSSFGNGGILERNLRAKSGYMTGNRGYAGYLNLASGRKIAFSLMVNHYAISGGEMRRKIQRLLEDLAARE